jgi:hypothetical protein
LKSDREKGHKHISKLWINIVYKLTITNLWVMRIFEVMSTKFNVANIGT